MFDVFQDLLINNNNSCVEYNGICAQHLFQLNNETSLSILMLDNNSEDVMLSFIEMNAHFISERCAMVLMPFLCQYIFPTCDSEGNISFPNQAECKNVQEDTCASEWKMIMKTSFSTLLPVCENLDDPDFDDENVLDRNINGSQIAMRPLQCHHYFEEFCGACLPLCGEFSRYNDETKMQQRLIVIVTATMNCLGGILVFIIAMLRRKEL